ncbi:MAG: thiamine-phosphate kinase [Pseudomonadota bacterium]
MTEFSLIERYCQGIGVTHSSTRLGVGDDAAILRVPDGMELVVSVDSMVEGVHFFPEVDAAKLASKLAAVNLSDMAAMGAEPKWATLALCLPQLDDDWLSGFSAALDTISKRYGLQLIGGDTTQGPLTLTMQIMGLVEAGTALCRDSAKPGDDVYVSQSLGDAALALAALQGKVVLPDADLAQVLRRLETPTPQVELGLALRGLASSCIDISDGLVAELGHVARGSNVAIEIDLEGVPLSSSYRTYLDNGGSYILALTGGDDYQLLFTAPQEKRAEINQVGKHLNLALSKIGQVNELDSHSDKPIDAVMLRYKDKAFELQDNSGYQHFQTKQQLDAE